MFPASLTSSCARLARTFGIAATCAVVLSGCVHYAPVTEPGDHFVGLKARAEASETMRVFFIHGMTTHGVGYAADFVGFLATELGCEHGAAAIPFEDHPVDGLDFPLRANLRVYRLQGAKHRLVFYEFLWSPLTQPVKEAGLAGDRDIARAVINGAIKRDVMDDGLSEAVLYVEHYHNDLLQRAAVEAVGKFLARAYDGPERSAQSEEVAFFSESLGSAMLYDALQLYFEASLSPAPGILAPTFRKLPGQPEARVHLDVVRRFDPTGSRIADTLGRTGLFVMFANQIPILELPSVDPVPSQPPARVARFLSAAANVPRLNPRGIDLVAMSDPNDLLSFRLAAQNTPLVKIHNVSPHNAWDWFGLFENPMTAHTGYVHRPKVQRLVIDGL